MQLLPDGDTAREEIAEIGRLAVEKSPLRAFAAFGVMTAPHIPAVLRSTAGQAVIAGATRAGLATGSVARAITRKPPSVMTRMLGNTDLLLRRELPSFCFDYQPDLEALRTAAAPCRIAVGMDSADRSYAVAARSLAGELGMVCTEFPGGHTAYQLRPEQFAERLVAVLGGAE
ncbi:hypothetical protein [Nocardia wallacei]|uniref:hypothetical protein n=1 Tax=Nocardia wallacei TaxID=480035 RepID=UPI002457F22A|nr:hypothetical protein [Nocardia wallacei]